MKRVGIGRGKATKGFQKPKPKPKPKFKPKAEPKQKEGVCFHCNEPGHWKRNCKLYLDNLKKKKGNVTT